MNEERIYIICYDAENGKHCINIDAYRNKIDAQRNAKILQACGHYNVKIEEVTLL